MRKAFALALTFVVALIGTPVGVFAAQSAPQHGTLSGTARNAHQQKLPHVTGRVRDSNGHIAASGTTDGAGRFSFSGLVPGNYTVEVVDKDGNIVGTTNFVAITAGSVATVTVTAGAAGAIAAARGGGLNLFGLGPLGIVAVLATAGAGTIAAIVSNKDHASPSR